MDFNPDDNWRKLGPELFFPEIYVWDHLLEEGAILDVSLIAKKIGFDRPVGITQKLNHEILPFGEDAVKGVLYEERVEDLLKVYRSHSKFSLVEYINFDLKFPTTVESAIHNPNYIKTVNEDGGLVFNEGEEPFIVKTFSGGRMRTKCVEAFGGTIKTSDGSLGIVFGHGRTEFDKL